MRHRRGSMGQGIGPEPRAKVLAVTCLFLFSYVFKVSIFGHIYERLCHGGSGSHPWTASVASGHNLLQEPRYNKGLAFTEKERDVHYLRGLLPPAVLTQELQVTKWHCSKEKKMMHNLRKYEVPLKRFAGLKDTLFFTVVHIKRRVATVG